MTNDHIVSSFDHELETIQAQIMKMGGLVERAIGDVARALETRDDELAIAVQRRNAEIDALEEEINAEAARVLAIRTPTAVDLRIVLTVLKISASLGRIGNYARNIARRCEVISAMSPASDAPAALRGMLREVDVMLRDVLDAYIDRDAGLAGEVIQRDQDVDQMYNTLFRELLTFMMEDPRSITPSMHLHFIAKNTERMGDLITAIAEQVVFLVSGRMPDEPRPKSDRTSSDPSFLPVS